jgi:predicted Zn-dependent protease
MSAGAWTTARVSHCFSTDCACRSLFTGDLAPAFGQFLQAVTTPRSQSFAALVAQQPDNELFRFSLAQALLAENRPVDAVEHLTLCAQKKADWMIPRILLGKALIGLNRKPEARRWLEEALQLAVDQSHEDPERELRAILSEL